MKHLTVIITIFAYFGSAFTQSFNPNTMPTSSLQFLYTQAMLGHISAVEFSCPGSRNMQVVCAETRQGFDRFMTEWDLYADWTSRVPVVPTPLTAWRREGDGYMRAYELGGGFLYVTYNFVDNQGIVLIFFVESAAASTP